MGRERRIRPEKAERERGRQPSRKDFQAEDRKAARLSTCEKGLEEGSLKSRLGRAVLET